MKSLFFAACAVVFLAGCVSAQLKHTSMSDIDGAIRIAQTPGLENPELEQCMVLIRTGIEQIPTEGGGIATTIAEKELWDRIDAKPACIVVKARIQAFFAKFGLVLPVKP